MSDIGGVWRTVGGRRIFIKDGQDLASAMKESGKFNSTKGLTEEGKKKIKELEKDEKFQKELNKFLEESAKKENEKIFKPRAYGAKSFEEHGVAFEDYKTNERFSDYLRDKYGTDDIDVITTGSEKTAKSLRNDFNKKSYDEYVKSKLNDDEYLKKNRPNEYFSKSLKDKK